MVRLWGSVLVLLVIALDAPARAQQWASPDSGFKIEHEAGTTRWGANVLRGYIRNDHGFDAGSLQLLIEGLDATGNVTSTTVGYLPGLLPAYNRLYFEVPVKSPAASYRVRLASYESVNRVGP